MIKKKHVESNRIRQSMNLIGVVLSNRIRSKKTSYIMKECMKRFKCSHVSVFNCDIMSGKVKLYFTSNGDRKTLLRVQECILTIINNNSSSVREPVIFDGILFQPIIMRDEISAYMVLEGVLNPEKIIITSNYADSVEEISITIDILQMQDRIRRNEKTDQLTMLSNEVQLRKDLIKCKAREDCMFVIVKIRELDIINKNCGIKNGNCVIYEVSKMLQDYVEQKKGGVYRFIGNMFGLILFGDYKKNYYGLIDLCSLIRNKGIETSDGVVHTRISVGIVEMKNYGDIVSVDDIYTNAISAALADDDGVTFYGERKEKENNMENTVMMGTIITSISDERKHRKVMKEQDNIPRMLENSEFDYLSLFNICSSEEKNSGENLIL